MMLLTEVTTLSTSIRRQACAAILGIGLLLFCYRNRRANVAIPELLSDQNGLTLWFACFHFSRLVVVCYF